MMQSAGIWLQVLPGVFSGDDGQTLNSATVRCADRLSLCPYMVACKPNLLESHCREGPPAIASRGAGVLKAQTEPDDHVMNKATDPLLITLSLLLAASVTGFSLGFIPYPYGLLVLGCFIVARILYLKGKSK